MASYQKYEMIPAIKRKLAERKNTTNTDLIDFTLLLLDNSRGADLDDVAGLEERFFKYLELCRECNMKVGNMAAYTAMGITQTTARDWQSGKRGQEKQELILKVKAVCAQYREAMMLDGTVKEITGIFWQKCFDGFRDNDPLTDYAVSQLPGEIDADAIMEKYKDLPED